MDKITEGIITISKSPENPGERTHTLAVLILLTMPVLAHTLWVGVNIINEPHLPE